MCVWVGVGGGAVRGRGEGVVCEYVSSCVSAVGVPASAKWKQFLTIAC